MDAIEIVKAVRAELKAVRTAHYLARWDLDVDPTVFNQMCLDIVRLETKLASAVSSSPDPQAARQAAYY